MARGDLYLYKRDVEAFRVPLADFLWRGIPEWVTGSLAPPPAESRQPMEESTLQPPSERVPAQPGLRDVVAPVVACVLALLAEAGMLPALSAVAAQPGAAVRPGLPQELHPAAAPALAPSGEIAGAWARPAWTGPRSAVKRAFFDLLERS